MYCHQRWQCIVTRGGSKLSLNVSGNFSSPGHVCSQVVILSTLPSTLLPSVFPSKAMCSSTPVCTFVSLLVTRSRRPGNRMWRARGTPSTSLRSLPRSPCTWRPTWTTTCRTASTPSTKTRSCPTLSSSPTTAPAAPTQGATCRPAPTPPASSSSTPAGIGSKGRALFIEIPP